MAGSLMRVSVSHADGSTDTYTVKPVTIVAFERQFSCGLGSLKDTGRMEHVYWLAWDSEKRSGKVVKPFDGWLEDVDSVDVEDEAAPLEQQTPTPAT